LTGTGSGLPSSRRNWASSSRALAIMEGASASGAFDTRDYRGPRYVRIKHARGHHRIAAAPLRSCRVRFRGTERRSECLNVRRTALRSHTGLLV
jgi:hypothetical protein